MIGQVYIYCKRYVTSCEECVRHVTLFPLYMYCDDKRLLALVFSACFYDVFNFKSKTRICVVI